MACLPCSQEAGKQGVASLEEQGAQHSGGTPQEVLWHKSVSEGAHDLST